MLNAPWLALLALAARAQEPLPAPRFVLHVLPCPADSQSRATAVNAAGHVAGDVGFGSSVFAAFWSATDQDPVLARGPGADFSLANDLDDLDTVVGTAGEGATAFVWRPGNALTELLTPGVCCPVARALDGAGRVLGSAPFPGTSERPTVWVQGVPHDLELVPGDDFGGLSAGLGGRFVGVSGQLAALWENGRARRLAVADAWLSEARGLNASGVIVGEAVTSAATQAVVWRDGKASVLATLGGPSAAVFAINARGWIVGYSQAPSQLLHATLWVGTRVLDLETLVVELPAGVTLGWAMDVNDAGQIVGSALVDGFERPFRLDPWSRSTRRDATVLPVGGAQR